MAHNLSLPSLYCELLPTNSCRHIARHGLAGIRLREQW
jgi:hypothetical protein